MVKVYVCGMGDVFDNSPHYHVITIWRWCRGCLARLENCVFFYLHVCKWYPSGNYVTTSVSVPQYMPFHDEEIYVNIDGVNLNLLAATFIGVA